MSISHCYCSDYMTKPTQFGDEPKIIYGDNISAAAQYAFTGNTEIGFIALSLAMSPEMKGKGKCYVVPQNLYTPIEQACVLIKKNGSSPNCVGKFI